MSGPINILVPVLALFCIQDAFAADLQPYEAVYATKFKGFKVNLKRRLQIQDSKITLTVDAKKFLLGMHETSELRDRGEGPLYTVKYLHKRRGLSHKHDKDLIFNWSDNTVLDVLHPHKAPLSIEYPSYDKLGFQAQMRLDMLRNPDKPQYKYTITNGVRNRQYTFDRMGEELLHTPLGDLRTMKFKREGDDDDREVFVWIALDWDFLLARIDQTKKPGGKTERLILKSARIADRQVTGLQQHPLTEARHAGL